VTAKPSKPMEMWVLGFFVHITYYYYGHRLPVTPDEAWLALATSSGQMVSISALGHQSTQWHS